MALNGAQNTVLSTQSRLDGSKMGSPTSASPVLDRQALEASRNSYA